MKKVFSIVLAIAMMFTLSIAAFAAQDDFLESPSKGQAPELEGSENDSCKGEIVIVPYGDRDKLDDEDKKHFEDAYQTIVDADDLSDLNKGLDDNSAVSDLFGIDLIGCDDHDHHDEFTVKLNADDIKNFSDLIYYNGSEWVVVADAAIIDGLLVFSADIDAFTPFAIVVSVGDDAPQTGDTFSWIYVALMITSGIGLACVCTSMNKKKD